MSEVTDLLFRRENEDVYVMGDWPELVAIDDDLLGKAKDAYGDILPAMAVDADSVTFAVANGWARYSLAYHEPGALHGVYRLRRGHTCN